MMAADLTGEGGRPSTISLPWTAALGHGLPRAGLEGPPGAPVVGRGVLSPCWASREAGQHGTGPDLVSGAPLPRCLLNLSGNRCVTSRPVVLECGDFSCCRAEPRPSPVAAQTLASRPSFRSSPRWIFRGSPPGEAAGGGPWALWGGALPHFLRAGAAHLFWACPRMRGFKWALPLVRYRAQGYLLLSTQDGDVCPGSSAVWTGSFGAAEVGQGLLSGLSAFGDLHRELCF